MLRADLIGTTSNLTAELQGEHGLYLEGIPVDGGILKYDAATKRVYVVAIDDAMSDTSENVVQNKVIKQYVDQNSGAIATISVNGVEQEIVNKNVNISVPTATSDLINDGDGESPFATETYVQQNGGKIDSISVNGVEQTIDENKNVDITVPTVNDSTITVQKNGAKVDSFTLNQSSNKSINITVPTQASDVHALSDSTKYGASLSVSGTTVQLKDQDGNNLGDAITTQDTDTGATSVDFTGSGNAITDASYSAANRKITFTKGATYTTASDVGTLISGKQDAANNTNLTTTDKTIVGAINEVNSLAKGRVYTKEYDTISDMVTALNAMSATELKAGDNVYIVATGVPDLWVGKVESSATTYTYTTDSDFVNAITGSLSTTVQVGYYRLCELETEKVDLSNVVDSNSTISSSGSGNAVTGMSIDSSGNVTLTKGITAVETTRTIAGVDLEDDVTKTEMQTALDFDTKLDKNTNTATYNRAYAVTSAGDQTMVSYTAEVGSNTLVQRNTGGHIKLPLTPTSNEHGTSKKYVDDNIVSNTRALSGSGAPTTSTVGFIGQIYIDTTNNISYQCSAINEDTSTTPSTFTYTWKPLDEIKSISAGGTALTPDANGNVNIPVAGNSVKGVVDVRAFFGNEVDAYGRLATVKASNQEIDDKTNDYKAIVPSNLNYAVKAALSDANHLTMTDAEKQLAQQVLGGSPRGIARL